MEPGRTTTSTPRAGVLCAGTVVVDLAKVIDRFPTPDRLAVIASVTPSTGGPGVNLAVDLTRLGAAYPVGVVGVVGQDEHGGWMRAELDRLGIDTSGLRTSEAVATSFSDAMILRDGGARTFFHHVGANALLTPDDVDLTTTTARILHLGAPGLHPALDGAQDTGSGWASVLAAAQAAGMHTNLELVSLEPERLRQLVVPCLAHLDSLVVNEIEACRVAGVELAPTCVDGPVDWAAIEDAARRLLDAGVRRLVAVHFPAGCVAVTPDGATHRQGSVRLPQDRLVNATGAGDAFAAGVIHGLHEGWSVPQCLRAGACVAASCMTGTGTSDVAPLVDCLALGRRFGFRPAP